MINSKLFSGREARVFQMITLKSIHKWMLFFYKISTEESLMKIIAASRRNQNQVITAVGGSHFLLGV